MMRKKSKGDNIQNFYESKEIKKYIKNITTQNLLIHR
jgi:hypothetical protein